MLEAAQRGATEGAASKGQPPPRILAVTVLTSMSAEDVRAQGHTETPQALVLRLGELAKRAGIAGLVCSPRELAPLRERFGRALFLCTPGIRPSGAAAGDQARAETPAFARRAGSDLLVVGRPIYEAPSPADAAAAIVAELTSADA